MMEVSKEAFASAIIHNFDAGVLRCIMKEKGCVYSMFRV